MAHLFIIAGHGAGDSGAVGNGYTEAERVRALASRIAELGGGGATLGDTSRNWYADKGISSLNIPKNWQILELHMDSASPTARGGHVIIKKGFSPDVYDNTLASLIGGIFPGRSNLIVGRDDLANAKRAATKGYGYRLMECGFISNAEDIRVFNQRMDEIARGILKAFGIKCEAQAAKEEPEDGLIRKGGVFQNKRDEFGEISYQVHARGAGWCNWQCDGSLAGSTGQNRRIEALRIKGDGKIDVSVHIKGIGDKEYKDVNAEGIIGTIGQSRRLEAVKITGSEAFYRYRVHQKSLGWSEWADNGAWAGTKGKSLQIEGLQVEKSMFSVEAHVQKKGWLAARAAENVIGITGHSLRLEALRITPYGQAIYAKAHIQSEGWVDYGQVTEDTVIGTVGEEKRIECLCMKGDFDYRVHVQASGWTDWTRADGIATLGTVGQALRLEAIQFRKRK
jgi:uncharacterized protein YjdB